MKPPPSKPSRGNAPPGESSTFYRQLYILLFLAVLIAVVTAVLLGLPNNPRTFSLAGLESRLVVPNTVANGWILLSDPEGGINSFVLSTPPQTYFVPLTLQQQFTLPRGNYRFWARHLNAGSRLKVRIEWPSDAPLQFCIVKDSMDGYLKDSSHCLVKLTSRSRIIIDYVARHSAEHFFIVESVSVSDVGSHPHKGPVDSDTTAGSHSIATIKTPSFAQRTTMQATFAESKEYPRKHTQARREDDKQTGEATSSSLVHANSQALRASNIISRALNALDGTKHRNADEEPEFFIIRADISFDMSLLQYDTAEADDLFVGSFSKEFEFNSAEWLVLYNPSDSHIYSVTISISRRYKELLISVFLLEFVLLSSIGICCYRRYSTVSLLLVDDEKGLRHIIAGLKTGAAVRHVGDTRSKSMDDVEDEATEQEPWSQGHPTNEQIEARINRRSTHPYSPHSSPVVR